MRASSATWPATRCRCWWTAGPNGAARAARWPRSSRRRSGNCPGVRFAKLDTEAAQRSAAAYGIRSIPTLLLFRGGKEVARRSGALPAQEIVSWVRSQVA